MKTPFITEVESWNFLESAIFHYKRIKEYPSEINDCIDYIQKSLLFPNADSYFLIGLLYKDRLIYTESEEQNELLFVNHMMIASENGNNDSRLELYLYFTKYFQHDEECMVLSEKLLNDYRNWKHEHEDPSIGECLIYENIEPIF